MRLPSARTHGILLALVAIVSLASLASLAACSHKNSDEQPVPEPDPISVRVKNENFLDMNIAIVTSGVSRRLGSVSGNAVATFSVPYKVVIGNAVAVTATPIGGRGQASTGGLNVSPGQVVEFRVAPVLRQSTVSVHDP